MALGRALGGGVDKVLASRVLAAVRAGDPVSAMHRMPGPDPLRRLVRAAGRSGASDAAVAGASAAIERYEEFIRDRVGDRSLLEAMLSAWVPTARREFELRRKQAAFKAMSQIKGAIARVTMATVVLTPSASGEHIDVVWINGLIDLYRVRPGATVKLVSRRFPAPPSASGRAQRGPTTLAGESVSNHPARLLLEEFSSSPAPELDVRVAGERAQYTLAGDDFGSDTAKSLVFAEVNRDELPRYVPAGPADVPRRKAFFFAEVMTPSQTLQFDVLMHRDLYPGQDPALRLYDTAGEGAASANDPSRDVDRLDMLETIEPLGLGLRAMRSADVPRYPELVERVLGGIGASRADIRGYRARIGYPIYGSQVMMTFDALTR
ncbi:MAG: hypothetical protein AB7K52_01465 [Phycisphaerales bacterium]